MTSEPLHVTTHDALVCFDRPSRVIAVPRRFHAAATGKLVGRSHAFLRMMDLVTRAAPTRTDILLRGPSGSGKEVVARAIHRLSHRVGSFVPVDCSAMTANLFESELFGHEKGSFTGAQTRRPGLVEAAKGGTLFLDEVGDIPLELQVKLLRLLESGSFRRVGSTLERQADFRLVCATHRDLESMVAAGTYRADLYFRISAFPIRLPALRERRSDIPLLVETGLRRLGREDLHVSREAMDALAGYDFPGNVRELLNIVERASILADGGTIRLEHVSEMLCRQVAAEGSPCRRTERGLSHAGGSSRRTVARLKPVHLERLAV